MKGVAMIAHNSTTYNIPRSKVLCVDNDVVSLIHMRYALVGTPDITDTAQYRRVPAALNAKEALSMILCDPTIGVVITGVHMHGCDGVWLAQQLQHYDPSIKVVAVTDYHLDDSNCDLFSDVFFKPIDQHQFRSIVAQMIMDAA